LILQDGGHSIANLLPVADLAMYDVYEDPDGIPNFDQISQSTAEIGLLLLSVSENKRPPS